MLNGHRSFQVSDCRHERIVRQAKFWFCVDCRATTVDRGRSWQVDP